MILGVRLSLTTVLLSTAVIHLLSVPCAIAQSKSNEVWTIVVYQDKGASDGWKGSVDKALERTVESNIEGAKLKLSDPIEKVSIQDYASILHSLNLISPSEVPLDRRQRWQLTYRGTPPNELQVVDPPFSLNSSNSLIRRIPNSSVPVDKQGQTRLESLWEVNCEAAPVVPRGIIDIRTKEPGGAEAKTCLKSEFNDAFTGRLYPRRMEIEFPDDAAKTKLLTAFKSGNGSIKIDNPREPTLFVAVSDLFGGSTAGATLIFVTQTSADLYYFAFVKSPSVLDKKLEFVEGTNWRSTIASNFEEYDQLRDRSKDRPEWATKDAIYRKCLVNRDDPKTTILLIGKSGGGIKAMTSDWDGSGYKDFSADISLSLDSAWLESQFTRAQATK